MVCVGVFLRDGSCWVVYCFLQSLFLSGMLCPSPLMPMLNPLSIPPPSLFVDVRRRIELIQDFEMPTVCTTIKVSKDGQYILATGKHLCGYDLYVFHNRKCSSRKSSPPLFTSVFHYKRFQTYRNTQKNLMSPHLSVT